MEIQPSSMANLNKAIFLDRDGVINHERPDYVKSIDELIIFPEIIPFIKKLKKFGFLIIVITNQSAINRGIITVSQLNEIHNFIQNYLNQNNTYIDNFFYCPHRPDENCNCRKPKPGLIFQAKSKLNIDLKSSWLIGNNHSDILAATAAGCKSIKISYQDELSQISDKILKC